MWRPYSVLLPVGFTVPALLPGPRCALAAPFRPYPFPSLTLSAGGILSVALSLTFTCVRAAGRYPAPWSHGARTFLVEASSHAAARPSGEVHIGERRCGFESGANGSFGWKADIGCRS
jgi:hypothetical protein